MLKVNSGLFYLSWKDYFVSLILHNLFFPDNAYELIGFIGETSGILPVVKQLFVAETAPTDLSAVNQFMVENGFSKKKNNDYFNDELGIILEDLHEGNVLTKDGVLCFVDTVFYFNDSDPENTNMKKSGCGCAHTEAKVEQMLTDRNVKLTPEKYDRLWSMIGDDRIDPEAAVNKITSQMEAGGEMISPVQYAAGGELNLDNIEFHDGKAVIKRGRKIVAEIFDRPVFYAIHNIPSGYSEKNPFQLALRGLGARDCKDLDECIFYIKKYAVGEDAILADGGDLVPFDYMSMFESTPEESAPVPDHLEESYQRSTFDKKWAPTRKEAIDKLEKQYSDAKTSRDIWRDKKYKSSNKSVEVGMHDDFDHRSISVDRVNEMRRQKTVYSFEQEMKQAVSDLKQLGLSESEIETLFNSPPEMASGGTLATEEYKSVFKDNDGDGLPNVDDPNPDNASAPDEHSIEEVKLSDEVAKIIEIRNEAERKRLALNDKLKSITPSDGEINSRTKTPYSIVNKLRRKRLLGKNGITDLIGGMVVVKDNADLDKVVADILAGKLGKVSEHEDLYKKPLNGYRAHHFIIDYDGMMIEVQVKTERMKKLSKASHAAYKNGNLDGEALNKLSTLAFKADGGDKKVAKEIDPLLADAKSLSGRLTTKMATGGNMNSDNIPDDAAQKMFFMEDEELEDGGDLESADHEWKAKTQKQRIAIMKLKQKPSDVEVKEEGIIMEKGGDVPMCDEMKQADSIQEMIDHITGEHKATLDRIAEISNSPERVPLAIDLYETDLKSHFAEEETILFPHILERSPVMFQYVNEILDQHKRINELMAQIQVSHKENADDLPILIADFLNMMEKHIDKENYFFSLLPEHVKSSLSKIVVKPVQVTTNEPVITEDEEPKYATTEEELLKGMTELAARSKNPDDFIQGIVLFGKNFGIDPASDLFVNTFKLSKVPGQAANNQKIIKRFYTKFGIPQKKRSKKEQKKSIADIHLENIVRMAHEQNQVMNERIKQKWG